LRMKPWNRAVSGSSETINLSIPLRMKPWLEGCTTYRTE